MTQEEIQLLLKDLCARLPYGVKCFAEDSEYGDVGVVYSVDPFEKVDPNIYIQYYKGNVMSFFTSEVRPYLRPMSSMTEEEQLEYGSFDGLAKCMDWLNAHHFDYRGLIEKGLAIAVTKENNPYERTD